VIRAVVHLLNDQPVVADLLDDPKADDQVLVCTNVRTLDGKPPVWLDRSDSRFVFPYSGIRFVEVPSGTPMARGPEPVEAAAAEPDELEIDEDFLRRVRDA
jgi:hypothetical protein